MTHGETTSNVPTNDSQWDHTQCAHQLLVINTVMIEMSKDIYTIRENNISLFPNNKNAMDSLKAHNIIQSDFSTTSNVELSISVPL